MWAQRAASDCVQGPPAGQRASVGDVFDPTAIRNQTLLGHHVIKVTGVELGEAVLLGNVDLRARAQTWVQPFSTLTYTKSLMKTHFVSVVP